MKDEYYWMNEEIVDWTLSMLRQGQRVVFTPESGRSDLCTVEPTPDGVVHVKIGCKCGRLDIVDAIDLRYSDKANGILRRSIPANQ